METLNKKTIIKNNPPPPPCCQNSTNEISSSPEPPHENFRGKSSPITASRTQPPRPQGRPPPFLPSGPKAGWPLPPPPPCRVHPQTRPSPPPRPYPPRSRSRPRSPKPLIAPGGVGERQRNAGRGDGEGLGVRGEGPARGGCVSEESLCATSLLWWDTKGEELVSGSETRWTSVEGTAGLSVGSRAREVWRHQRLVPPGSRHKMAAAAPTRFSYVTDGPALRKQRPSKIPTPIPGSQLRPEPSWLNTAPRGRRVTKGAWRSLPEPGLPVRNGGRRVTPSLFLKVCYARSQRRNPFWTVGENLGRGVRYVSTRRAQVA